MRGACPEISDHPEISVADICCDAEISAYHKPLAFYLVAAYAVDSLEISALPAEISA